jgi:hypothetical protein
VVDIKYDYQDMPGEACRIIEQSLIDDPDSTATALLER